MKQFVVFLLILLTATVAVFRAQADDNTIGIITPLTGRMAVIGTAVKNGVELARLDNPETFNEIQVNYEDDQGDAKQSITAYENLKRKGLPKVVLGFGDSLGYVVGRLAEQDKIPLINFNFEAGPAIGKSYVVRAMNHTRQYMQVLADYLLAEKYTSFSIIRAESPFFNAMSKSFTESVGARAKVSEIASFDPTDIDFRSIILKLRSHMDEPVGLFLAPDQLIAFSKQAQQLGVKKVYFGTDLFETAASISLDKNAFEGAIYSDNNVSSKFRERYRQHFGNVAQLTFGGAAYDMAILIAETIHAGNGNLIDSIQSVKSRKGVLGKFSFASSESTGGFFQYPVTVKSISNGIGTQR